jgi:hypothetical protein
MIIGAIIFIIAIINTIKKLPEVKTCMIKDVLKE